MAQYRSLAGDEPAAPAELVDAPAVVSGTHQRALDVLDELLGMAMSASADRGPARLMLRTLQRSRPMLLADFAKVPEEQVAAFMGALGAKLCAVADPAARPDAAGPLFGPADGDVTTRYLQPQAGDYPLPARGA